MSYDIAYVPNPKLFAVLVIRVTRFLHVCANFEAMRENSLSYPTPSYSKSESPSKCKIIQIAKSPKVQNHAMWKIMQCGKLFRVESYAMQKSNTEFCIKC